MGEILDILAELRLIRTLTNEAENKRSCGLQC
jgi:hypothetical protein